MSNPSSDQMPASKSSHNWFSDPDFIKQVNAIKAEIESKQALLKDITNYRNLAQIIPPTLSAGLGVSPSYFFSRLDGWGGDQLKETESHYLMLEQALKIEQQTNPASWQSSTVYLDYQASALKLEGLKELNELLSTLNLSNGYSSSYIGIVDPIREMIKFREHLFSVLFPGSLGTALPGPIREAEIILMPIDKLVSQIALGTLLLGGMAATAIGVIGASAIGISAAISLGWPIAAMAGIAAAGALGVAGVGLLGAPLLLATSINPFFLATSIQSFLLSSKLDSISQIYRMQGFDGYDASAQLYKTLGIVDIVSASNPFFGLILSPFKQIILESAVDSQRANILAKYNSFTDFWDKSYITEWDLLRQDPAIKKILNGFNSLLVPGGFDSAIVMASLTANQLQLNLAALLREGESLSKNSDAVLLINSNYLGANALALNERDIVKGKEAKLDFTGVIDGIEGKKYIQMDLLSPGQVKGTRESYGKNSYRTGHTINRLPWELLDNNTSTTVNLVNLSSYDSPYDSPQNQGKMPAAKLNMAGGNDVLVVGGRSIIGEMGKGFDGVDYTFALDTTALKPVLSQGPDSTSLGIIATQNDEDKSMTVAKYGRSVVKEEYLQSHTYTYGKRSETIESVGVRSKTIQLTGQTDKLTDVEWIKGSVGWDILKGNSDDNFFVAGSGGSDAIYGGEGNDWVDYGTVSQLEIFTTNNKGELEQSAAIDRVAVILDRNAAVGTGIIRTPSTYRDPKGNDFGYKTITPNVDVDGTKNNLISKDKLDGIENVRGGVWSELIVGTYGDNVLIGSGGSDAIYGLGGDDVIMTGPKGSASVDGGTGFNVLGYGPLTESVTVIATGVNAGVVHKSGGSDTYKNISAIRGGGGSDMFKGTEFNDFFNGESGNDQFSTEGGDDQISTGAGRDTVTAGAGNDVISVSHMRISRPDVQIFEYTADNGFGQAKPQIFSLAEAGSVSEIKFDDPEQLIKIVPVASRNLTLGLNLSAPNTTFNWLSYIASHEDLIKAYGVNQAAATQHYNEFGMRWGWTSTFDALNYIASDPSLIRKFGTDVTAATVYYINHGYKEARREKFNALQYLLNYPDLQQKFGLDIDKATRHYIEIGSKNRLTDAGVRQAESGINISRLASFTYLDDGSVAVWLESAPLYGSGDIDIRVGLKLILKDKENGGIEGRFVRLEAIVTDKGKPSNAPDWKDGDPLPWGIQESYSASMTLAVESFRLAGVGNQAWADAKLIDGGSGDDLVDYRSMEVVDGSGIAADLSDKSKQTVSTWRNRDGSINEASVTDYLQNIENLGGTNGNDRIVGTDEDNSLLAHDGNDYIDARAGNDLITTGNGRDTLLGGAGNDTFVLARRVVAENSADVKKDVQSTESQPALTGRYIMVRKNTSGSNYLSFAELEVWSRGINVAQRKDVISSGSHNITNHHQENLVDGRTGGNFATDGIYASSNASGGWIQVDLGASLPLDQINLFGRTDQGAAQNGNYTVYVGNQDMRQWKGAESDAPPGVVVKNIQVGQTDKLSMNARPIVGRYVMVRKNSDTADHLSLAELQAWSGGKNVAHRKTVSSSLSANNTNHYKDNLVDGKSGGSYAADGIFASASKGAGWVQVDLLSSTRLDQIILFGRTDQGSSQNGNYTVYVSDQDMSKMSTDEIEKMAGVFRSRHEGTVGKVVISDLAAAAVNLPAKSLSSPSNSISQAEPVVDLFKRIDGGDGSDTVDYQRSMVRNGEGIEADLSNVELQTVKTMRLPDGKFDSGSVTDELARVENLGATQGSDKVIGSDLANSIWGYAGDDLIEGRGGNDTIFTGAGNDKALGGEGNDTIVVERGQELRGRYVMVRKNAASSKNANPDEFLALAELQVWSGKVNVARDRSVVSSGIYQAANTKYAAQNLVDGKTGGSMQTDGIYASSTNGGGWVQVDLGSSMRLDAIKLFGRTDGSVWQSGDYTVYVSDQDLSDRTTEQIEALSGVVKSSHVGLASNVTITRNTLLENQTCKEISGGDGTDTVDYQQSLVFNGEGVLADLSKTEAQTVKTRRLGTGTLEEGSVTDRLTDVEGLGATRGTDQIIGSEVANRLWAYEGDDLIEGRGGNDAIMTGTGNDTVYGGEGNDTIVLERGQELSGRYLMVRKNAGTAEFLSLAEVQAWVGQANVARDKTVISSGTFQDTNAKYGAANLVDGKTGGSMQTDGIYSSSNNGGGWIQVDLGSSMRLDQIKLFGRTDGSLLQSGDYTVYLSHQDLSGKTTEQIEALSGVVKSRHVGAAGQVTISRDTLIENKTRKEVHGGDGIDAVDYQRELVFNGAGIEADLSKTETQTVKTRRLANGTFDAASVTDQLTSVENLGATQGNDRVIGSDEANTIWGYDGDDTIEGRGGNDTLMTGTGNDLVSGGDGDDTVIVERGAELSGRYVMVRKNAGVAGVLALAELQAWVGNSNVAQGKSVLSSGTRTDLDLQKNLVDGKTGGDALKDGIYRSSHRGGDWIQVDLGSAMRLDQINLFGRTGDEAPSQNGDYTVYVSHEDLSGMTIEQIEALSGLVKSRHVGQTASVTITRDTLLENKTIQKIDGGDGVDTVDYQRSVVFNGQGIEANLSNAQSQTVKTRRLGKDNFDPNSVTDELRSVENLGATRGNDRIVGGNVANKIWGYDGDDAIEGRGGDDTILTGNGKDSVNGGDGDDTIIVDRGQELSGRYVMVRKNDGYADGFALAELKAWRSGTNVAQGMDVASSGSGQDTKQSQDKLVDGKDGGNLQTDGMFVAANSVGGWIQVDLKETVRLDRIELFGRTDQSLFQSKNYTVYLSNQDMRLSTTEQIETMPGVIKVRMGDAPSLVAITRDTLLENTTIKEIDGGVGNDTVDYQRSVVFDGQGVEANLSSVGNQTVRTRRKANGTFDLNSVSDQLKNVENLGATNGSDRITGSAGANKIWAYEGDDYVDGGDGNDIIVAGGGEDTVFGGDGDDAIYVDHATESVSLAGSPRDLGSNFVSLGTNIRLSDVVLAEDGSGVILGSRLVAGPVKAILSRFRRQDDGQLTFWAQTVEDDKTKAVKVSLRETAAGLEARMSAAAYVSGDVSRQDFDWDSSAAISTPLGNGTTADFSYVRVQLRATIYGGAKTINGGHGTDFVSYRHNAEPNNRRRDNGIGVDLTQGKVSTWRYSDGSFNLLSVDDSITGIENVGGTEFNDSMQGDANSNTLLGYEGADVLNGLGGHDTLVGGAGSDTYQLDTQWGQDLILEEASSSVDHDRVILGSGVSYADLWFSKQGDSLVMSQVGTSNQLTVVDWYSTDASKKAQVEEFRTTLNGQTYVATLARVESLVNTLSAYNRPATTISNSTLTTTQKSNVNAAISQAWQLVA